MLLIPVGTQVVTRAGSPGNLPAGAVGVVIEAPADSTHPYRIRFPDGSVAMLRRAQLSIRKHVQSDLTLQVAPDLQEWELNQYVIYRCVVGSHAFGLAEAGSDIDRRGIYLPPAALHWSLYGVPEQLESKESDEVYWELQKFLILALKANPNVLECLYTPEVEHVAPVAAELLSLRSMFLSKLVYQTYNGYVLSQFKRLEQGLRSSGEIRWKHAMHLIRLLLSGITILREGLVPLHVGEYREQLLAIRHAQVPWSQVDAWRLALHTKFDDEYQRTSLPDRPNYARANSFLIKARRSMAG